MVAPVIIIIFIIMTALKIACTYWAKHGNRFRPVEFWKHTDPSQFWREWII